MLLFVESPNGVVFSLLSVFFLCCRCVAVIRAAGQVVCGLSSGASPPHAESINKLTCGIAQDLLQANTEPTHSNCVF